MLARIVDGVVFVVNFDDDRRRFVQRAMHELRRADANILGTVLNHYHQDRDVIGGAYYGGQVYVSRASRRSRSGWRHEIYSVAGSIIRLVRSIRGNYMRAPTLRRSIDRRDLRVALLASLATLLVSAGVAAAAITGSGIRDGSIWGRDIRDGSISGVDVRNGSITSADVLNGSVHNVDLRDGTITGRKIQNGTVESVDVANGALTGRDIGDGSLGAADIGAGTLGAGHLDFDVVTQAELATLAAPGFVNLASNPVDWTKIKNMPAAFADGVDASGGTAEDIACAGCVDAGDIATGAIGADALLDGSVVIADLAFDPATQAELDALAAAGTINSASNPVHWTKLASVPAGFADGTDAVDGGNAAGLTCTGCVDSTDLGSGAVESVNILDESIAVWHIATGAVTNEEILDGTIQVADLGSAFATGDGTINQIGDILHWTKLLGVPAGLADGTDETIAIGGATSSFVAVPDGSIVTVSATCGGTDRAIGGSFTSDATADDILVLTASEVDAVNPSRWNMTFSNVTGGLAEITVTPKAVCLAAVADS